MRTQTDDIGRKISRKKDIKQSTNVGNGKNGMESKRNTEHKGILMDFNKYSNTERIAMICTGMGKYELTPQAQHNTT